MTRLRGHHLFCATLFQGSGYDQAFTAQMERTLAALEAGEDFTLCAGPDSLCAACPNLRPGERCAHGTSDVARRDAAALAAVGFQPGQSLSPSQAGERLRQEHQGQGHVFGGGQVGQQVVGLEHKPDVPLAEGRPVLLGAVPKAARPALCIVC